MPLACLLGIGPPALTSLGAPAPVLRAGEVRLVGLRSVDEGEKRHLQP